jgi:hypothetical protein
MNAGRRKENREPRNPCARFLMEPVGIHDSASGRR